MTTQEPAPHREIMQACAACSTAAPAPHAAARRRSVHSEEGR
jgi:hypothetical protein